MKNPLYDLGKGIKNKTSQQKSSEFYNTTHPKKQQCFSSPQSASLDWLFYHRSWRAFHWDPAVPSYLWQFDGTRVPKHTAAQAPRAPGAGGSTRTSSATAGGTGGGSQPRVPCSSELGQQRRSLDGAALSVLPLAVLCMMRFV